MDAQETPTPPPTPPPAPAPATQPSSSAAYAARPRWSHDDDDSVTVVQSTHDYTQSIFKTKPQSARWVRGLAEDGEEEYPAAGLRRRRTNMHAWEELDDTPDGAVPGSPEAVPRRRRPWLFWPNVLVIAYLCFLAIRMLKGLHHSYRLDFPTMPRQLTMYGRRYGENAVSFGMRVCVPLGVPHGIGALGALLLSYTVGETSHNFIALCGVGLSLLSLLALFTQCSYLFTACYLSPVSRRWECELPFVLHHVCTTVRTMCPLMALWCVAPVLDQVRGSGYRWRCVLAVPCLAALVSLALSIYDEAPSYAAVDVAHAATLLATPLFVKSCWRQKRFVAVAPAAKPHED